jgi:hypothetical protein
VRALLGAPIVRVSSEAERGAHNAHVTGAIPVPATKDSRWPEGIRGRCYERRSQWFNSTQRGHILPADGLAAPALRRLAAVVRVHLGRPTLPAKGTSIRLLTDR